MYFLEQKQFKPAMILFGIPFIPCIIGLIIANIMFFEIELLIMLMVILLIYLSIVLILMKLSKRKNHYLLLKDDIVEIVFHDFDKGITKLEIPFNKIKKIEYYRIVSLKSWLMLHSYIYPKCVFLTYDSNGEEVTKFIGYMDIKDVKEVAKNNIELKIY